MTSRVMATHIFKCNPAAISFSSPSSEPVITCSETSKNLRSAADEIRQLKPVVFPTETVYGLAASAYSENASSQIFSIKGRPPDNPLIVHVASIEMLDALLPLGFTMPPSYRCLIDQFWPGALTLLFPARPNALPSIITAKLPTVAIRMPSHPVARALISLAGIPLAAPSANSSGKPSPTKAEHVYRDLNGKIGIILDAGPCGIGVESTVVDGLNPDGNLRVLRPGGVTVEDLETALKRESSTLGGTVPQVLVHGRDFKDAKLAETPTTPGMKYRHYSPSAPVVLLYTTSPTRDGSQPIPVKDYFAVLKSYRSPDSNILNVGLLCPKDSFLLRHIELTADMKWHFFPLGEASDLPEIARRLFDGFLTLDQEGVDVILVEEIQQGKEGLAAMNRIEKAARESRWISV
jgi:L-threonylcarbamoyladenylate synthase